MKMIPQTSFFLLSFALCLLCVDAQAMDHQPQETVSTPADLTSVCLADIKANCFTVTSEPLKNMFGSGLTMSHYSTTLSNGNVVTASRKGDEESGTHLAFYTVRQQQENSPVSVGDKKTIMPGVTRYIDGENAFNIFQKLKFLHSQAKSQENKE